MTILTTSIEGKPIRIVAESGIAIEIEGNQITVALAGPAPAAGKLLPFVVPAPRIDMRDSSNGRL